MKDGLKQRIFILGSGGRLGAALMKAWQQLEGIELIVYSRAELDFSQPEKAVEIFKKSSLKSHDLLVNCAAMTHVDRCEEEPDLAMKVNATTPGLLAQLAADASARFLQVSTDYVFDGILNRAYRETDLPNPLSHYGASKLAGEQSVMAASPHHYIVRVSWVFGPERPSFIDHIIEKALTSDHVAAIADKTSSPSFTTDLTKWLPLFFSSSTPGGLYHLCNTGACSWRDYGEHALQTAARCGMALRTTVVEPLKLSEMKNFIAKRPPNTALETTKFATLLGKPLRTWQEAVEEYVQSKVIGNK
jgi:dTDP-4-dehydrorhamnose reductase